MNQEVQQRLLTLNREFYATVAEPFDATRLAAPVGKRELVRRLPLTAHATIADIGCGNGRLAWLLEERHVPLDYVGVDANAQLLALAQTHTAGLHYVRARFVQADLAQPDWPTRIDKPDRGCDIVTCLATLQHLPGFALRATVMQQLAALATPEGIVAVSAWQFLSSERFVAKQIAWSTFGIEEAQVEAGDALLPWQQGKFAVRYVHQIDEDEMTALAAAAGLMVEATYRADGKEGNLNLYAILRRT